MNTQKVISIDPGGTTGVAMRLETNIITCVCKEPEQLYDFFKQTKFDHVIIENFAAELISKYGLHTVRIVGGVTALCYYFNIPITLHHPTDRRPFMTEAKEHLAGERHMVHQVDALAHLFRWEYDQEHKDDK